MSSDRIARCHALRTAILQWLTEHPHSTMVEICDQFCDVPDKNVHTSILSMRKQFIVLMTDGARGKAGRYHATGEPLPSEESVRERLSTNFFAKDARLAGKQRKQAEINQKIERAKQSKPGHYIHTPGKLDTSNSRGQGAVRPRVYVNCQTFY